MVNILHAPQAWKDDEYLFSHAACDMPERLEGFHLRDMCIWHHLLQLWDAENGPALFNMDLGRIASNHWLKLEDVASSLDRLQEGGLVVRTRICLSHTDAKGVRPVAIEIPRPIVPAWYLNAGWDPYRDDPEEEE